MSEQTHIDSTIDPPDNMLLDTDAIDAEKRKGRRRRNTAIGIALTFTFVAGFLTYAGVSSFWNPKTPGGAPEIVCQDPNGDITEEDINIFCSVIRENTPPEDMDMYRYGELAGGDPILSVPRGPAAIRERHCNGRGDVTLDKNAKGTNTTVTMLKAIQTMVTECSPGGQNPDWLMHVDKSADEEELDSLRHHIKEHHNDKDTDHKTPTAIMHENPVTGKPEGSYALNQAAMDAMKQPGWKDAKKVCEPVDATSMSTAECMKSMGIKVKTVPRVKTPPAA